MTLLFIDGFDHYADANLLEKWDSIDINDRSTIEAGGRTDQRLRLQTNNGYAKKSFNMSGDTFIMGFAVRPTGGYNSDPNCINIGETDGNWNNTLNFISGNILRLNIRGTTYDSDAGIYPWGDGYFYIEIKVVLSTSATGSVEVKLNGVTVINETSVQTADSITTVNTVMFYAQATILWIDDLYIADGTGSDVNDFIGDVGVSTVYPDGAGNSTQWAPSAGSNYENVDEEPPDDDTTYNDADAVSEKDLYTLGDLGYSSGTIYGIQVIPSLRKTTAGGASVRSVIRTGSTDYNGSANALGDSFEFWPEIWEDNPNTSLAWTISDINGLEAGVERTA